MTTVRALVYRMMDGILAPAYSIPSQSAFSLAQCVPAQDVQPRPHSIVHSSLSISPTLTSDTGLRSRSYDASSNSGERGD